MSLGESIYFLRWRRSLSYNFSFTLLQNSDSFTFALKSLNAMKGSGPWSANIMYTPHFWGTVGSEKSFFFFFSPLAFWVFSLSLWRWWRSKLCPFFFFFLIQLENPFFLPPVKTNPRCNRPKSADYLTDKLFFLKEYSLSSSQSFAWIVFSLSVWAYIRAEAE